MDERAPFQVLALPYTQASCGAVSYAIFRRSDDDNWQGIAGGGEGSESPLEAAKREAQEEAGIDPQQSMIIALDSLATVPVPNVTGKFTWGPSVLVIPEYTFGIGVQTEQIILSDEHDEYRWLDYDAARQMLRWDSNRNALWELHHRLAGG